MKILVRAALFSLLSCLGLAEVSAQVGRRVGRSSGEIAVPLPVPPVPPEVNGPDNPADGAVVKCTSEPAASADAVARQAEQVFRGSEVETKAVIAKVPDPVYTEQARQYGTYGLVALRVTLHSTGRVMEAKVLRGLPDGLTMKAIDAACQIEFTPARKDGRAVSQYVTVEFNFETDDMHLPPPRGRRFPSGTRIPLPWPGYPRFP